MPTTKKRVNLTIPDNIYERLQAYKKECGLMGDAAACLQLIVQQLNSREEAKTFLDILRNTPTDLLMQQTEIGYKTLHEALEKGEELL